MLMVLTRMITFMAGRTLIEEDRDESLQHKRERAEK
jgi:hypothetical protein